MAMGVLNIQTRDSTVSAWTLALALLVAWQSFCKRLFKSPKVRDIVDHIEEVPPVFVLDLRRQKSYLSLFETSQATARNAFLVLISHQGLI